MSKIKQHLMNVSAQMGKDGVIDEEVIEACSSEHAVSKSEYRRLKSQLTDKYKNSGPAVKCLHCGDVLRSMHRHDYKWCSCHSVMIDGGSDYTRFGHSENAHFLWVKSDKDLDATLVGPRDKSEDKQWCHICEELVLESSTEEFVTSISVFGKEDIVTRRRCLIACTRKEA